ncbi:unnamed protein product [Adineta steineri]|uniref:Uncharacterized protein n=1 Tax=Adineta steineri TaxID=433720 RepID=A0A819TBR1_9BILA|nr:unnamed protein product [Adineta steineri]CAF4077172.1 unnamed protein product [Adineta steineri]
MNMTKPPSIPTKPIPRFYFILLFLLIFIFIYWFRSSRSSSSTNGFADVSQLPKSSLFTYTNISSQVFYSETQGILYLPPNGQSAHFVSLKSKAVRGNHRHKDNENSISGEVIILLQGQFQLRIGDGDTNQYEDHQFDACKMGIIALQFSADNCHALKNIGKNTNWFAAYYLKSKEIKKPPVDKDGCKKMLLT